MVIQEKTYGTDVEAVVAEIMVKFQAGYNTLKNEEQVLSYMNQMIAWNLDLAAIPRAPATATQACTLQSKYDPTQKSRTSCLMHKCRRT